MLALLCVRGAASTGAVGLTSSWKPPVMRRKLSLRWEAPWRLVSGVLSSLSVFFFQAEDGIRDLTVTGVQTCALPISFGRWFEQHFVGTPPRCRVLRYGLEHTADVTARDIRAGAQGSQFTLVSPAGEARVVLGLPGRHKIGRASCRERV